MGLNKKLFIQEAADDANFNIVTYTGTGSIQSITGVGFQPDLVWIKNRTYTDQHSLADSVRGGSKWLASDSTQAESTNANAAANSFDSDGFTVSGNYDINRNNSNFVAWCWKAGGAAVSNTSGSITSSVSANTAAGFSIVKYTGNGTNGATVGHGLSSAPELIILKNTSSGGASDHWLVGNTQSGWTQAMHLNLTNASATSNLYWNDTAPTSSVFTLGHHTGVYNANNDEHIAYCWYSVSGHSKIGSYTGNTSGVTVTTGFQPRWIMIKDTTDNVNHWVINDAARDISNPRTAVLFPNLSNAEADNVVFGVNFLSNGFQIPSTTTSSAYNKSGNTYIYFAIA